MFDPHCKHSGGRRNYIGRLPAHPCQLHDPDNHSIRPDPGPLSTSTQHCPPSPDHAGSHHPDPSAHLLRSVLHYPLRKTAPCTPAPLNAGYQGYLRGYLLRRNVGRGQLGTGFGQVSGGLPVHCVRAHGVPAERESGDVWGGV